MRTPPIKKQRKHLSSRSAHIFSVGNYIGSRQWVKKYRVPLKKKKKIDPTAGLRSCLAGVLFDPLRHISPLILDLLKNPRKNEKYSPKGTSVRLKIKNHPKSKTRKIYTKTQKKNLENRRETQKSIVFSTSHRSDCPTLGTGPVLSTKRNPSESQLVPHRSPKMRKFVKSIGKSKENTSRSRKMK